jgi:hypothetical protein
VHELHAHPEVDDRASTVVLGVVGGDEVHVVPFGGGAEQLELEDRARPALGVGEVGAHPEHLHATTLVLVVALADRRAGLARVAR